MSVHKKLMEARVELLNTKLTKSGHNKFAGYQYFELGDFLPSVQTIFNKLGLCGVVSFGVERATLTITDIETDKFIEISSPMAEANLKGCHPIQNLGAAQTYLRRYLWVTALEIVEHDALDATTGGDTKGKGVHKPTANELYQPEGEERAFLIGVVASVNSKEYNEAAEYLGSLNLDNDEKVWVWDKLDSKTRSAIKKHNSEKEVTNG